MSPDLSDNEWQLFKSLRTQGLDRYCERVLAATVALAGAEGQSNQQQYTAVRQLLNERDEEIDAIFDSERRSTAIRQLAVMRSRDLISDEEIEQFSDAGRAEIAKYMLFWQPRV